MLKLFSFFFFLFLFICAFSTFAQQESDTFHVYFGLNIPVLNKKAQHKIDSLIYADRITPGKDVMIVGYADYLGTEGHNKTLSEQRANNVADYLTSYNISKENIKLCIGKGEIERKGLSRPEGYPTDRKVDVVVESITKRRKTNKGVIRTALISSPAPSGPVTDISLYTTGQTFVLKNLYFLPERHTIRPQSAPVLENLFNTMLANPTLKIQIEGHVCCIKDYPDAMDIDNGESQLSVNRAKVVYQYLVQKGISAKRLKYVGYGRSKPLVVNEITEEDANRNRRVEIRILEK